MSDWQYRDRLAEQVREALGDFDDRTQPVIVLVAALRAALDQERADNEKLRAFAQECDKESQLAQLIDPIELRYAMKRHGLLDANSLSTALLSGRGEGGNDG